MFETMSSVSIFCVDYRCPPLECLLIREFTVVKFAGHSASYNNPEGINTNTKTPVVLNIYTNPELHQCHLESYS